MRLPLEEPDCRVVAGYLFIQYYELWLPFWTAIAREDDPTMLGLPPFLLGARELRTHSREGKHKLFMHYARAMLNMSPDKIKNNKAFEFCPGKAILLAVLIKSTAVRFNGRSER